MYQMQLKKDPHIDYNKLEKKLNNYFLHSHLGENIRQTKTTNSSTGRGYIFGNVQQRK